MGQVVSGKRVNPPAKMLTFLPPGVLLGISGGGVPLDCPNPDPVLKNVIFHTRFQTRPLRTASEKDFLIRIYLFLSYSFGIETINAFRHVRSSLKTRTRFQTKKR